MAASIDCLVKAGFVTRQVLASDHRVQAALRDAGREVSATVKAEADQFREAMLADVYEALLVQLNMQRWRSIMAHCHAGVHRAGIPGPSSNRLSAR